MMSRPTCLVLGAGASVPYGFPSGRKLLLQISHDLFSKRSRLSGVLLALGFGHKDLKAFSQILLLSMQPSVDAFLENRPEYMELGKAAIAAALVPCETMATFATTREKLGWYEYLFNQMGTRRDNFASCQLSIVTFNYDRSLEYFLITTLTHSFEMRQEEAAALLGGIPLVHVYGQIGKPHYNDPDGRDYSPNVTEQTIAKCVTEMKILHEGSPTTAEFRTAHDLIRQAEILCFLGFGYHATNLFRLKADELFAGSMMLGTCFHLMNDEVRRIRTLFPQWGTKMRLGNTIENNLLFLRNHPVFD